MNKDQRKLLEQYLEDLSEVMDGIEAIKEEEEEKYENLPENFQESERGEELQNGIDTLDDIISELEDIIDRLQEMV